MLCTYMNLFYLKISLLVQKALSIFEILAIRVHNWLRPLIDRTAVKRIERADQVNKF